MVEGVLREWMADIYDNASRNAFAWDGAEEIRRVVAEVFGAPNQCLALVKNTSEGVNAVAQGFPWREGDNVVISEFEHESNTFPWRHPMPTALDIGVRHKMNCLFY